MRFLHKIYAYIGGYYWKPCPICRKHFGGHERGKGTLCTSWGSGESTCPNCKEESDRRNEDFFKQYAKEHPLVLTATASANVMK